jgi:hypothetical protein
MQKTSLRELFKSMAVLVALEKLNSDLKLILAKAAK